MSELFCPLFVIVLILIFFVAVTVKVLFDCAVDFAFAELDLQDFYYIC